MAAKINSPLTGEIDIEEKDLIFFPKGLPGFAKLRKWVLAGEDDDPIKWMISAELGRITLPVTDPVLIDPEYSPSIPGQVLEELGIGEQPEALLLAVLNIPRREPWKGTANLLAPLVLNPQTRTGRQVVLIDDRYSVYTPLISEEEAGRISEEGNGDRCLS